MPRPPQPAATHSALDADIGLPDLLAAVLHQPGSTRVLASCLPLAVSQAGALHPGERIAWLGALRTALQSGGLEHADACEAALTLASRWSDWPLTLALCAQLETMPAHAAGLPVSAAQARVQALHASGCSEEAIAECRRRMLIRPQDSWPLSTHAGLCAWQAFASARAPAIVGEALRLEPLGHQHLQDFAWQYHDPEIARLCCLPVFADDGAWHAWLDRCWSYGDQRLYAVLHPEWGFVGSVSLIQHGQLGFFYYWLGPDFQGHGLGPSAVALLLAHARDTSGLRGCYAKVFDDNHRSQRGLEKLGFRALGVRGIPPFDGEMFYRLHFEREAASDSCTNSDDEARDIEELRWLLERMDAETRLAAPLSAGGRYGQTRPRSA